MSRQNNLSSAQAGGVLVYVFIGVVLFALLVFTFSKSFTSVSTSNMTIGEAKVEAAKIVSYATALTKATKTLILKGCSETQLSFENSVETGYVNAGAPSDKTCHIFDPAGGKMTWKNPPTGVNNGSQWMFVGGPVLHETSGGNSTYTNSDADLVVYLFSVNEDICRQINASIGMDGIPVDSSNVAATAKFTGTYTAQENITGLTVASQPSPCSGNPAQPNLCGKSLACFREEDAGQRYIFVGKLYGR